MNEDSCPSPSARRAQVSAQDDELIGRLVRAKRIAVVGLSNNVERAAWMIAEYLVNVGKEVVPVNPRYEELMGLKCYPSVAVIPGHVDLVDVFRRSEFCPGVVEDATASQAGAVWLQSGIVSPEARRLAEQAGLDYVEDRCLMVEHRRRH
jgi:predicted CoA-binding protein